MNSNRSQYTSAPTYGLQKKGLAKKLGFGTGKDNLVPDFEAYPAQPTIQDAPASSAPVDSGAASYQTPQIPFNPSLSDPYVPFAQAPVQNVGPVYPSQSGANPAAGSFSYPSPAQQGYGGFYGTSNPVNAYYGQNPQIPQVHQAPEQNAGGAYAYSYPQGTIANPENPYYGNNPFMASPVDSAAPQNPGQSQPTQKQVYAAKPRAVPPQSGQPQKPSAEEPSRKMSANQLIALFLYGVLPILFIVAFFQTPIFYAFIALALVGLVVLWYRNMYPKPVRLIVSCLLTLLCIVGVIKLIRSPGSSSELGLQTQSTSVPYAVTAPIYMQEYAGEDLLATETPVPTPAPTTEISAAEKRLCSFMDLWRVNNAESMVSLVQPSWVNKQSDAAGALFQLLSNRTAEEYTIESVSGTESDTSRSITMTALINKNTGKDPSLYRFTIMMVKEGDEWYVNPNSIATNNEVKNSEEENVVNDSNSKGLATAPPRNTVTPIPAGSTTLYYNVDGGSYYHTDPYCASVNVAHQPLTGTFSYSELGNYKSWLSPCMRCNAPVYTMPPQ